MKKFNFVFDSTEQKTFGAGLSIGHTSIDLDLKYFKTLWHYYHIKLIASFNPDFVSHIYNATEM